MIRAFNESDFPGLLQSLNQVIWVCFQTKPEKLAEADKKCLNQTKRRLNQAENLSDSDNLSDFVLIVARSDFVLF